MADDPFDRLLSTSPVVGETLTDPFDRLLASPAVEQRAGSTPTKAGLKSLLPTKEELPEFIGSTAGGVARRTIPGAALSSAGAALGELVRQGYFEDKPLEVKERVLKILAAAGRGALGETIGRGVGKLFTPFRGGVTPELESGRKAAESAGIKAPLSNLTESKFVQATERGLEYTPFGTAIAKQRKLALEGFRDYTEKVGRTIAVDRPSEVTGNLAKQEIEGLFEKFNDTTGKMYDAVLPMIRQANPEVRLDNTISTMQEILEQRGGEFAPAGLAEIQKSLDNIIGKSMESKVLDASGKPFLRQVSGTVKVFDELKKFRTNVGLRAKFNDPSVSGLQKDLKHLYGAMTEDLNATVKSVSERAFDDLQLANKEYARGQQILKGKLFSAINNAKPENVYKLVILPKTPSQVELGRELLGDTFDDVARQWWDDVVKTSTNPEGVVSPVKLAKKLDNYGSTVDKLAEGNPALMEQFDTVKKIANLLSKGRETTQGSQTAFNNVALGQYILAIGAMLSNPGQALKSLGALGTVMGAEGLGVAGIKSGVGRELLTRGYPKAGKAAERATQLVGQLGLQKASE